MPLSFAPLDKGILPDRMIAALADDGGILPAYPFVPDQIQPASLDLRLGEIAYRVRASFLPGPGATVAQRIDELKLHEIVLTEGAVLETELRLHRAADREPRVARRHRRGREPEKLDRPARRVHARHRRRDARLRSHRGGISWPALCRDQPEDVSGAGARRLAAVADAFSPRQGRHRRRCAARAARARTSRRRHRSGDGRRHRRERRSRRRRPRAAASAIAPSATPG